MLLLDVINHDADLWLGWRARGRAQSKRSCWSSLGGAAEQRASAIGTTSWAASGARYLEPATSSLQENAKTSSL